MHVFNKVNPNLVEVFINLKDQNKYNSKYPWFYEPQHQSKPIFIYQL
jgi:hypothetical protein